MRAFGDRVSFDMKPAGSDLVVELFVFDDELSIPVTRLPANSNGDPFASNHKAESSFESGGTFMGTKGFVAASCVISPKIVLSLWSGWHEETPPEVG